MTAADPETDPEAFYWGSWGDPEGSISREEDEDE